MEKAKFGKVDACAVFCMLLIMAVCIACAKADDTVTFENVKAPQEVKNVIVDYFASARNGDLDAVMEILYFENDFEKSAYQVNFVNEVRPVCAVIHSIDKINDQLYVVTLNVEIANSEISNDVVYNYIVRLDGKWRYILAKDNIPESILGDADLSIYSYANEGFVSTDDVLQ